MRRAFKFRAYMNQETEANLKNWLRLCQQLYNCSLEQRIDTYHRYRRSLSEYDQARELKTLKMEFPEYKLVGSQVLKDVIRRLDRAYKAFFRRATQGCGAQSGFPKFQKLRDYNSFTFPNTSGWKFDGKHLDIKYVGVLKLRGGRPPQGTICTVTVKVAPTGKWFVIFSCKNVPKHPLPAQSPQRIVALSEGITHLWTDSEGHTEENPHWYQRALKRIRVLNRSLARKKPGSRRHEQARLALAREHERIANRRDDFIKKRAHEYAQQFSVIGTRVLDIRGLIQSKSPIPLAQKIHDAAWRKLQFAVASQCEDHEREFMDIPAPYTVMECSQCGEIQEMPLHVRIYRCQKCGLVMARGLNSALNMKSRIETALAARAPVVTEDVDSILDEFSIENSLKTISSKWNY